MLLHGRSAGLYKLPTHMKAVKRASYVQVRHSLAAHGSIPTLMKDGGKAVGRPGSSPRPSSSSSDESSSRSDSSALSSVNNSDGDDESPPPPAENSRDGGGGDDQKEKKDDSEDGHHCDSGSSSDSSAEESDTEKNDDDRVSMDAGDDRDNDNGVDPTDDDLSEESDGSSDLENSYPRLPPAPVDVLINFRHQAAHKELQLTEELKQQVIADARRRYHERQQAHHSNKKTPPLHPKQRHSQKEHVTNELNRREKRRTSVSTDVTMARQRQEEDEWLVDCSCGLKKKNYDDGTSMIQCDDCLHWVHAKCADKLPEAVAQEKFLCFRCGWMFDCVCTVRRQPNHDDGQRMVECEGCKTWQHTMCVGIPMTEEPAHDYRCPRCVKKARLRQSDSKGRSSRHRHRRRTCAEAQRHSRQRADSSRAASANVRSSARSPGNPVSTAHSLRSKRAEVLAPHKKGEKAPTAMPSPPAILAASPPSTPPPPPSPPPPSRSAKYESSNRHTKQPSRREKKRSSASTTYSPRKRSHSLGRSLNKTRTEASKMGRHSPPSDNRAPSPRGKGLMLRGYSPAAAKMDAFASRTENARPPLPLTPLSSGASCENSLDNHGHIGRKRKVSSARDRLAKKLKIRKSSMR